MKRSGSVLIQKQILLILCIGNFEGSSFGHESSVVVHFGCPSASKVDLLFVEFHPWVLSLEGFDLSREVGLDVEAKFVGFHVLKQTASQAQKSKNKLAGRLP